MRTTHGAQTGRERRVRPPELVASRVLEPRVAEREAGGPEPRGLDARARQEELVRHLAEEETRRDGGERKERGAAQDAPERARELAIGDGLGRDGVHRPREGLRGERVEDRAHEIVDRDPADPLDAAADGPARAQTERREHRAPGAAPAAQHHAAPEPHDADPGARGGVGPRPPFAAGPREEGPGPRAGLAAGPRAAGAAVTVRLRPDA